MKRARQHELDFPEPRTHGGRRRGAGRKRNEDRIAHIRRGRVSKHDPLLVTQKLRRGLPSLRAPLPRKIVLACIARTQNLRFRIVEFSIQSNHLHLIVEADDAESLRSGTSGFFSSIARRLNALWKRRGSVFSQRFHDLVLKTLKQVRHALRYVLNNDLRHGSRLLADRGRPDSYSSGRWFDGWADYRPAEPPRPRGAPVVPGGWKLRIGWKQYYSLLRLTEVPAAR